MEKKDLKVIEATVNDEKTSEQLSKEVEAVASEILEQQKEKQLKNLTNPSAIALTSTQHSSGSDSKDVRKTVKQLFNLYLTNQFVNRAINIRADSLISRGFRIVEGDDKGRIACGALIENSGGVNLFWQLSVNTDIAGDGFLEKIYNQKKNKIVRLKHVHPLTLQYKTNEQTDKIITDKHGNPVGFTQYYVDNKGMDHEKDINMAVISHLKYNTLGDEFTGISTIQSGYDTIVRLMNMEYAAAESAVKTANPIIVGKCNTKSPQQIALWGTILGRINGREQVFIPQDMDLEMLSPGPQNFSDYSAYFLDAVIATFGVPRAMLLGESGGGNRAESVVLSRHFYSIIRGNQRYIEDLFNTIFKEYAELAGFEAPKLQFEDVAEDVALSADSAIALFTNGLISKEEARQMIGLYDTGTLGQLPNTSTEDAVKKSNAETWHNNPGQKPGSQAGEKKAMKQSDFSDVSASTK